MSGSAHSRYLHDDVTRPGALGGSRGSFDVATCNFGLSDIDDLGAAIAAVGDVLKPGGLLRLLDRASVLRWKHWTSRVPGRRQAATTTRDTGRPEVTRSESAPTRRRQPPDAFNLPGYAAPAAPCGWTSSPSRPRSRATIRPTSPTVSRSTLLRGADQLPAAPVSADPGPAASA